MTAPRLHIDTAPTNAVAGPSSAPQRPFYGPSSSTLSVNHFRSRSLSNASSSSLDIISPAPSSNASTSSLISHAGHNKPEPAQTDSAKSSLDETIRPDDYVLALHDYVPQTSSATCLSFRAGQVIRVFNRDTSGWWDGELDGRRGWFPSNYVDAKPASLVEEDVPVSPVVSCAYSSICRA